MSYNPDGPYNLLQLQPDLWRIVEDDRSQYPFCYVLVGSEKLLVVDTGSGTGDIFAFIRDHILKRSPLRDASSPRRTASRESTSPNSRARPYTTGTTAAALERGGTDKQAQEGPRAGGGPPSRGSGGTGDADLGGAPLAGAGTVLYDPVPESGPGERIPPFVVLCTHTHFDHCGCNSLASAADGELAKWCFDLCVSGADLEFSRNAASGGSNSVASFNKPLKPYSVTRWLAHGDVINLGGNRDIVTWHIPGHTPDSMAIYDQQGGNCFVGDAIYRWSDIYLYGPGASINDHERSLRWLHTELCRQVSEGIVAKVVLRCGHVDSELKMDTLLAVADLCAAIIAGSAKGKRMLAGTDPVIEYADRTGMFNVVLADRPLSTT